MNNMNWEDLELDLSGVTWMEEWNYWDSNDLDMDFSELDIADKSTEESDWTEGWDKLDSEEENADTKSEEGMESEEDEPIDKSTEEDTDTTLDEIDALLKELDDSNEEWSDTLDEAQKIINSLKWQEWGDDAVKLLTQLQDDNKWFKSKVDELQSLVSKLSKEKWDLSLKNAELELYWSADDAEIIYLNWNITKARWGDEKAKKRIVSILDNIRSELTGMTKEDEDSEYEDNKIYKFMNYNWSRMSANTKSNGWIDDFTVEL